MGSRRERAVALMDPREGPRFCLMHGQVSSAHDCGRPLKEIDPKGRILELEPEERGYAGCSPRAHAERTAFDSTAGIRVSYGPNMNPTFMVHCLECHSDFGPYYRLADAQGVDRWCMPCWKDRVGRRGREN